MDETRKRDGETAGEPAGADEAPAGGPRADRPSTVEALQAEAERLAAEAERNFQQFLRTAADLENYRKQAARQREDAVAQARRALIGVILGVVDTLERALDHADAGAGEAAAILDGIRLAHRQVLDTLRALGVRPMEALGRPFDPRVHEAVEAVPAGDGVEPGVVVAEVQRGYLAGDDVLRPARVRVAQ
jgi:molecular chaperone GrpE